MAKEKVIVSFDYEHDYLYYLLLKAWDANKRFDFYFSDITPKEIQTNNISVIKRVLSSKIHEANYMIALIGEHSDELHPDYREIGFKNWQAYEIRKNIEVGNKLIVVKLAKSNEAPLEAYNVGAKWVSSFNEKDIVAAIDSF